MIRPNATPPRHVVFDLGGVLIDWNPRYLYRRLFGGDEAAVEAFLNEVCTPAWNERQDAGRTIAEAEAEAIARHPDKAGPIRAYYTHFDEMAPGPIAGTLAILERLHRQGASLYALTNWSAETFARTSPRFPFLDLFKGIVVSGVERTIKPDRRIYDILVGRYGLSPGDCLFIDDSPRNVAGAEAAGWRAVHFRSPEALASDLKSLSLL